MFNIILADPPWSYRNKRTGGSLKSGSASKYPTLPLEEIQSLKVPADKDAVLFLWSTVPLLPDALSVMRAWGFTYVTKITWHKIGRKGMGFWFRGEVEDLLVGKKGKIRPFRCQLPNFIEAPVQSHSEKPEIFRGLIETATSHMAKPRRLELFARTRVPGWTCLGFEIDGMDIRESLEVIRNGSNA